MDRYRNVRKRAAAGVFLLLFSLIMSFPVFAVTPGGEWEIISREGSIRSENEAYKNALLKILKENNGVLDKRKYTEYSKTVLALTAAGYDPRSFFGYDLLSRLDDDKMVTKQGLNGPVWALIALDSGTYPSEKRSVYIAYILERELPGGGWNMEGKGTPDPDTTAMAVTALSNYTASDKKVKEAVSRGIRVLSSLQDAEGGYSSFGAKNAESDAQVIIALTHAGIDIHDSQFVKNGHTVLDDLMTYRCRDGSFRHVLTQESPDAIATEQADLAFAAIRRIKNGKSPLYRIK